MAVRFFGQYLLENGVITAPQLLEGISYQEKSNRKFGETAVSLGLITEEQLSRVLSFQRTADLRTGEAAMRLGLLTANQVDQVLRAQQNSHVLIGEALILVGAITRAQLEKHLAGFRTEQDSYRTTTEVPSSMDPTGVGAPAVDLTGKFLFRIVGIVSKLVECRAGALAEPPGPTVTARIGFGGDFPGELAVRCATRAAVRIASRMAGEAVGEDDRDGLVDGVRELLNVVCGSLSAAVARGGKKLEVEAPLAGELPAPRATDHYLVARLEAAELGLLEVVFASRG